MIRARLRLGWVLVTLTAGACVAPGSSLPPWVSLPRRGAIAVLPLAPAPSGTLEPPTAWRGEIETTIVECLSQRGPVIPPSAIRSISGRMRREVAATQQIDASSLGRSTLATIEEYALRELLADEPAVSILVQARWVRSQAPIVSQLARWHDAERPVLGAPVGFWQRLVSAPTRARSVRALSLEISAQPRRGPPFDPRRKGIALLERLDSTFRVEQLALPAESLHEPQLVLAVREALGPLCEGR